MEPRVVCQGSGPAPAALPASSSAPPRTAAPTTTSTPTLPRLTQREMNKNAVRLTPAVAAQPPGGRTGGRDNVNGKPKFDKKTGDKVNIEKAEGSSNTIDNEKPQDKKAKKNRRGKDKKKLRQQREKENEKEKERQKPILKPSDNERSRVTLKPGPRSR